MEGQIRMSPDLMRERASEYRAQAEVVSGVIGKMDSLLNQLREEWEGAASVKYGEKYQELRPGFVSAEGLIHEIAAALERMAKDTEELDRKFANQM